MSRDYHEFSLVYSTYGNIFRMINADFFNLKKNRWSLRIQRSIKLIKLNSIRYSHRLSISYVEFDHNNCNKKKFRCWQNAGPVYNFKEKKIHFISFCLLFNFKTEHISKYTCYTYTNNLNIRLYITNLLTRQILYLKYWVPEAAINFF